MNKITRFQDIPQFTQAGSWECDFPLTHVFKFIDEQVETNGLDLDPDFQRGHVWTKSQQRAWLEFFLQGGKTARVIYLNDPNWQKASSRKTGYSEVVIVDGKQRLEAIRCFVNNEVKVFGSYFNEFTDNIRLSNNTIKININDLQSRKDVLQWYLDFNSGGVVHSEEEIEKVKKLLKAEK